VPASAISDWDAERWAEIARDTRHGAAEAAAAAIERDTGVGQAQERYDGPEDMIITLRPAYWAASPTVPAPPTVPTAAEGAEPRPRSG
jgi:hypothetical protein